jgi:oligopeptide/dipeptide ABC transporter ATP-binding protein
MKRFRREVQMIFQNPYESLDLRYSIGATVMEPLTLHGIGHAAERRKRALEALAQVELRPAEDYMGRFPQDLSGGQRQRVAIARALVLKPRLIVADEPVSMLDVSIRSGIMNLMEGLREQHGMAYLYITHDLAVARYMSTRIAVMYLGVIIEEGLTEEVIRRAAHPYTRLLLAAVPGESGGGRNRVILQGEASAVSSIPQGCRFHPRCPLAKEICVEKVPPVVQVDKGRFAACHFANEVVDMPGPGVQPW